MKGTRDGGPPQCGPHNGKLPRHGLMAEMHAVEIADGGHTTTVARGQIVNAPHNLHTIATLNADQGAL